MRRIAGSSCGSAAPRTLASSSTLGRYTSARRFFGRRSGAEGSTSMRSSAAAQPKKECSNEWSTFDDPSFQALHDELLDLRHKCVAHSDYDRRKVFIVPAGARMFKTGQTAKALGTAVQNWALPLAKWEDVHSLCMELGSSISLDAETELQMLYSGGLQTPEPFELRLD